MSFKFQFFLQVKLFGIRPGFLSGFCSPLSNYLSSHQVVKLLTFIDHLAFKLTNSLIEQMVLIYFEPGKTKHHQSLFRSQIKIKQLIVLDHIPHRIPVYVPVFEGRNMPKMNTGYQITTKPKLLFFTIFSFMNSIHHFFVFCSITFKLSRQFFSTSLSVFC